MHSCGVPNLQCACSQDTGSLIFCQVRRCDALLIGLPFWWSVARWPRSSARRWCVAGRLGSLSGPVHCYITIGTLPFLLSEIKVLVLRWRIE